MVDETFAWEYDYEAWDESTARYDYAKAGDSGQPQLPKPPTSEDDNSEDEELEDEDFDEEYDDEELEADDQETESGQPEDSDEDIESDETIQGVTDLEGDDDASESEENQELPDQKPPELQGEHFYDESIKRWVQRFDNTSEFFNFTYSDIPLENRISQHPADYRTLNESLESSRKLADYGWPDGVAKILAFTAKLNKVLEAANPLPEVRYDVEGIAFDLGRYNQGEPEFMMYIMDSAISYDAKPPKLVRIVSTIDITSSPETFIIRGAAVCALTHMLELHGVRVQVDAHCGSNNIIDTWIRVKDPAWPMNIEQLVFILAHPVVFHKLVMSSWEHLPSEAREAARGLGTKSWGYISEPKEEDQGDIYISALGSRWLRDEAECLKWITGKLDEFGVHIELEEGVK